VGSSGKAAEDIKSDSIFGNEDEDEGVVF